jgi:glycerophosphoryl diester phosphodiesterase
MKSLLLTVAGLTLAVNVMAHAFDLQGHRGARGLLPENTLPAFAKALEIGVTTLELDLAMTRDGVLVVHHDEWLNPDTTRRPDGSFLTERGPAIHSLTLEEVRRYDVGRLKPGTPYAKRFATQMPLDGTHIPTLADVFDLVASSGAGHIRYNIETKITPTSGTDVPPPDLFAEAVGRAIADRGLTARATVQSFDWRTLAMLRRIVPDIERVCLTSEAPDDDTIERGKPGASPWLAGLDIDDYGGSTPRLVAAAGCSVWSPDFKDLTPERIAEAKAADVKVIPWTVNEPADMARIIDLGVDGLISDYPDRLRAVLVEKGIAVPPQVKAR